MAQQTAVEWLIEELGEYFPHEIGGIHLMVNQAKAMEKEQIINAHLDGMYKLAIPLNEFVAIEKTLLQIERIKNGIEKHDNGIEYYNETYDK
jgi:hypothetical protein